MNKAFHKPIDSSVLLKRCEDAKTIEEILEKIPEVMEEVFDTKVFYLWYDISYNDHVSNTHSCPMDGVENFSGDPDLPRSYKGFQGTIKLDVEKNGDCCFFNSFFGGSPDNGRTLAGLNFGSGSGSRTTAYMNTITGETNKKSLIHFVYNIRIYLDDFPTLKKELLTQIRLHKLKYSKDTYGFIKTLSHIHNTYTAPNFVDIKDIDYVETN